MSSVSPVITVIRPKNYRHISQTLIELWSFRELLLILVHRNISLRFAQTSLGITWVILQPLIMTLIFTFIFGYLARFGTSKLSPYPIIVFSGLLLWQYFSRCVSEGSTALQSYSHIIAKVYFPRVILLMVPALAAILDVFIAFIVLLCMVLWYRLPLSIISLIVLPLIVFWAAILAFSVSLVLASLGIRRRDIMIALPFLLQIGMYLTPVIYPVTFVPAKFQWLFYFNPMATLIGGVRWVLLGTPHPPIISWINVFILNALLIFIGTRLFERAEENMVDEL